MILVIAGLQQCARPAAAERGGLIGLGGPVSKVESG
jgi:hypothetical protein